MPDTERRKYGHQAPPTTRPLALARLDELELEKSRIETQLEHKEPEDYRTDKEFDSWRRRAIAALGHINAELRFIEKWLSLQPKDK